MAFISGPGYVALPRKGGAWVIEDLLPIGGGLLNVFGQPKKGKSYLALQLAAAIADPTIGEVLGFPIRTHGPVAYLQIDTPRGLWADRIAQLQDKGTSFENVLFADQELVPYPFNILGEGYGWLQQNLRLIAPFPVAVIVDTIREVHGGEENDSGHMRNIINLLVEAVRPASLILLSHARKEFGDSSTSSMMSEIRGTSYVAGRMDCVLKVTDTSLIFQGRTVGESRVVIKRDAETGLFVLSDDFDRIARAVLEEFPEGTTMERAKTLNQRFPKKSLEACRSLIRRLEKLDPVVTSRVPRRVIDLA
jgi:hypothetical protein